MEAKVEHEVKTISAVQPAEKIEHEGDLLIGGGCWCIGESPR